MLHLNLARLRAYYADGGRPDSVLEQVAAAAAALGDNPVFLHRVSPAALEEQIAALAERARSGVPLPLFGVPFAVKDNIDVAGMPTTAGCPSFAYVPSESAPVVDRLCRAGALVIGKTHLDQFATGLVGTRSPYGPCLNAIDPRYIAGGSSSGSAVAVASGVVSFALGTDTAGSGRVPAAFNGIIGYKPTRGRLPTSGVVPACRSLDCVSVFSLTAEDAREIAHVAAGAHAADPYSARTPAPRTDCFPKSFGFGVPPRRVLASQADEETRRRFEDAVRVLEELGGVAVEVDFGPFEAVARLLYEGPWVAERWAAVGDFVARGSADLDPTVRSIIESARSLDARAAFEGMYALEARKREAEQAWAKLEVLLVPSVPTHFTLEEVLAEPVSTNRQLGFYTNFVNLLDLAAVAVPVGQRESGLPFGVTLIGRAFADAALLTLAGSLQQRTDARIGALGVGLSELAPIPPEAAPGLADAGDFNAEVRKLVVVGAHLSGMPLNGELVERGGRLSARTRTACDYRLYALANTTPPKPGLVREVGFEGPGLDVEVWELPVAAFGDFVSRVPAPLVIGKVTLSTGEQLSGFLCEPRALAGAEDITHFGGWRSFREAARSAPTDRPARPAAAKES
jgi:allophanate hydrolase